jgi:hypothetical protein
MNSKNAMAPDHHPLAAKQQEVRWACRVPLAYTARPQRTNSLAGVPRRVSCHPTGHRRVSTRIGGSLPAAFLRRRKPPP